jgi:hypothetical protein
MKPSSGRKRTIASLLAGLLLLAGCEAFNRPDIPATLSADNLTFQAEFTALAQAGSSAAAAAEATRLAGQATLDYTESINQQLMATARVVVPRTPNPVVNALPASGPTTTAAGMQLVDTVVAGNRSEVDGCAVDVRSSFQQTESRIYVITRAVNITAGSRVNAEWWFGGQQVASSDITIGADDESICLWFYIDSSSIPFTPGEWTVRVLLNEGFVPPEVSFTVQ